MSKERILVIDDELQMRKLLRIALESSEYKINDAATGAEGMTKAKTHDPDLIILDLGLPDESGHTILKKLRQWYKSPVIILSVQSDEQDIVEALDNGANDYLVKPFRSSELLARIRSALRLYISDNNQSVFNWNNMEVDIAAHIVKKDGRIIKLTSTEYSLLELFVKNEGKVLTHQYLLTKVWGPSFVNELQYLRVYLAQLRKKIEDNPNKPVYFITESSVGYRFVGNN
jgi:two-component system, OmpR family, KDP operon response regulator KdpE